MIKKKRCNHHKFDNNGDCACGAVSIRCDCPLCVYGEYPIHENKIIEDFDNKVFVMRMYGGLED